VPVQTNIEFSDFLKAIKIIASQKFKAISIINKPGSGRRIELFLRENDPFPKEMWVVHESKYVYSKDLKKACSHLGITVNQFEEIVHSL